MSKTKRHIISAIRTFLSWFFWALAITSPLLMQITSKEALYVAMWSALFWAVTAGINSLLKLSHEKLTWR